MKTKTTVIAVLGTQKDDRGGDGEERWNAWRPTIGLVQQDALPIDELHLVFDPEFTKKNIQISLEETAITAFRNNIIGIARPQFGNYFGAFRSGNRMVAPKLQFFVNALKMRIVTKNDRNVMCTSSIKQIGSRFDYSQSAIAFQ